MTDAATQTIDTKREPLIVAHDLALAYRRRSAPILSGIDAEIRKGELLCMIGPNGGGKTTLLRALAGLLPPRRGTVNALQQPLYGRHAMHRRRRARLIAVVLTHTIAPAYLTVNELVRLGRLPYGDRDNQAPEVIPRVLKQSGIVHLIDRPVGELSDGERQRVMVARALAQEPRILLLDEPAVHLDPPHQSELFSLLHGLVVTGVIDSVAIATHHLHLAMHFADRFLLVADGNVVSGDASRIFDSGEVERAFLGDDATGLRLDPDRGWFVPERQADTSGGVW